MKWNHKLSLITATLLLASFFSVVYGTSYYDTNYNFMIPEDSVFLGFDELRAFDYYYRVNSKLFFDLPEEYSVSSLVFSGENCNLTITELGENSKLYVADVVGSGILVNFTLGYAEAYLQTTDGEITNVDVDEFGIDMLNWTVTGTGSCEMKVPFPVDVEPYYLKIDGDLKTEGVEWSESGNVVTVTDNLGSTHAYELGFIDVESPPSPPPSSSPGVVDDDDEPLTEPVVEDVGFLEQFLELADDFKYLVIENLGITFFAIVMIGLVGYLISMGRD